MKTTLLTLTIVVCLCSLLLSHVTAAPASPTQLTEKERQDIIHYAAKIIRTLLRPEDLEYSGPASKRNSGMLDAVMNMPDLMGYGRRK